MLSGADHVGVLLPLNQSPERLSIRGEVARHPIGQPDSRAKTYQPIAELVEKSRVRRQRSLARANRRWGRFATERPHPKVATVRNPRLLPLALLRKGRSWAMLKTSIT
jgi:hypothetical protein